MTPRVEYWVMRVLLHQGRPLQLDLLAPGVRIAATKCIDAGTLAMLPDGCIVEPVEVFDEEARAHEHRALLVEKHPHDDFRVVLNADVAL